MPPKQDKQDKGSEVLASTFDRGYMLRELLSRDARSETLAHLILQRCGYWSQEPETGEAEIVAEVVTLHDALCRDYGISLLPMPTAEEVAEIRQDIIEDLASGSMWLLPAEAEILALFDTAFPALTAHIREAWATQPVPDSLAADALAQFIERVMSSFLGLSGQEMSDGIRSHLKLVVQAVMAERQVQDYHALRDEEKKALITHELAHQVKERIVNIRGYAAFRMTRNWVAPGEQHIARHADGTVFCETSTGRPPPPGEPPTVSLIIDLTKVHLVGVTELAKKFTASVNEALKKLPTEWDTFPEELTFLRTISWEDFERDLRRFTLHTQHGLTFRHIAFLEDRERDGYPLPSSPQRHIIGKPIPGEDGVEKSVKKIMQAMDRNPYRARRKRIDTPAQGLGQYSCSIHPLGDWPADCPSAFAFLQAFNATAPTDSTGQGKETVAFDELPDVADSAEDENRDGS